MEPGFYQIATIGSYMGSGITDALACTLDGVVKQNVAAAPYTVANEYICGRLALAVGLPAPPGTIAQMDDGAKAYVMLRFGHKGDKPPPVDPVEVVTNKPQLAAGVVVFDDWILNRDRHAANLAYIADAGGLSIFDHGHALLGIEDGKAIDRLTNSVAVIYLGGKLAPHLSSRVDLMKWAGRIRQVPDELVRETCDTPRRLGLITGAEAKATAHMLNERKRTLAGHIEKSRSTFFGIDDDDWGLTP